MSRFSRLAVLLAAAALLVAAAPASVPAAGNGPTATASKSCPVGDSQSYNTTYVLSINAKRVPCRRAKKLVRKFHKCRPGKKGRCPNIKGYSCTENRTSGAGSYTSKVKCKKGRKVVKHEYNQWT